MEQQIKGKQNKIYWVALASLFFGVVAFFTWGILSFIAIILGIIGLKQIKKIGLEQYRKLAILGIILGVIGMGWVVFRSILILQTFQKSGQEEIEVTVESIKNNFFYTDTKCNVGVSIRNGTYKDSDYRCGEETFNDVFFEIYDDKIAIGDLNGDSRNDAAVIIRKTYGNNEPIYELVVSINKAVIGAKKRMLVPRNPKLLEGKPDIESIKIESGIISLGLARCCPIKKESIRYILDKETQGLEVIQ